MLCRILTPNRLFRQQSLLAIVNPEFLPLDPSQGRVKRTDLIFEMLTSPGHLQMVNESGKYTHVEVVVTKSSLVCQNN